MFGVMTGMKSADRTDPTERSAEWVGLAFMLAGAEAGEESARGRSRTEIPDNVLEVARKNGLNSFKADLQFFANEGNIKWTNHGYKHFASPKLSWKEVVSSTKSGPAKYLPGTDVEALERIVWETGTPVTNGKSWKVMKFENVIGASGGAGTQYIRVEMSSGTIHGHPITAAEYLSLIKQ